MVGASDLISKNVIESKVQRSGRLWRNLSWLEYTANTHGLKIVKEKIAQQSCVFPTHTRSCFSKSQNPTTNSFNPVFAQPQNSHEVRCAGFALETRWVASRSATLDYQRQSNSEARHYHHLSTPFEFCFNFQKGAHSLRNVGRIAVSILNLFGHKIKLVLQGAMEYIKTEDLDNLTT